MSLVSDPFYREWLDVELGHLGISHKSCANITEILDALDTDPPEMVFADLSRHAHSLFALRERGWFGPLFAIGEVSRNLCYALGVTRVLSSPLSRAAFRDAVAA